MPAETMTKPRRRRPRQPDLIHWPKASELVVRAAEDEEGEAVRELVDAMTQRYGWALPIAIWSQIKPFWYVAEVNGQLLGAVQVCVGWPVGRIELLSVRPGLSQSKTAKVVKSLVYYALQALQRDGTHVVMGLIPTDDEGFTRILERAGAQFAVKGKMYTFPLQRS